MTDVNCGIGFTPKYRPRIAAEKATSYGGHTGIGTHTAPSPIFDSAFRNIEHQIQSEPQGAVEGRSQGKVQSSSARGFFRFNRNLFTHGSENDDICYH